MNGEMSIHGIEFDEAPVRQLKPNERPDGPLRRFWEMLRPGMASSMPFVSPKRPLPRKKIQFAKGFWPGMVIFLIFICFMGFMGWALGKHGNATAQPEQHFVTATPNDPFWGPILANPLAPDQARAGEAVRSEVVQVIGWRLGTNSLTLPECKVSVGARVREAASYTENGYVYTAVEYLGVADSSAYVDGQCTVGELFVADEAIRFATKI